MIIVIQLLFAIIGLLVYVLATRTETKEVGRITFAFGLLAFLLRISPDTVGFLVK